MSLQEIAETIKKYKRVMVSAHIAPDPDAVGSSAALALGLRQIGVDAIGYLAESVPERVRPLLQSLTYIHEPPKERFDALIVVDTASRKRVGPHMDTLSAIVDIVVNIDHHASNDAWGALNFIDATSASSAQIVFQLLKLLGVSFTAEMLNLLFAGLVDDTGSFRFSNTNVQALRMATEMVESGAQPEKVAAILFHNVPQRVLKLKSLALTSLEFTADGKICLVVVTQEMLSNAGAKSEDTDGLIEEARSAQGVQAAVLIRELPDGWKLSLRSKESSLDVNEVAGVFGGGGHKAAAGCKMTGAIDEVKSRIVKEIQARL